MLNKGTTGTIFITSLVWRGPWLGIEPGTPRTRNQYSTTWLTRRRLYNVTETYVIGFANLSSIFNLTFKKHIFGLVWIPDNCSSLEKLNVHYRHQLSQMRSTIKHSDRKRDYICQDGRKGTIGYGINLVWEKAWPDLINCYNKKRRKKSCNTWVNCRRRYALIHVIQPT